MCWRLVIDYPHTSFDNCRSIAMSGYDLTYKSTMCHPIIYALKFAAIFVFMNFLSFLGCILLKKKFFSQEKYFLVIITPPKHMQALLFHFGYRCLNHNQSQAITTQTLTLFA
jgi:hypothetical protein